MKSLRRVFGLLILLAVSLSALSMDTDVSVALRNRPAAMPAEEAAIAALLPGALPQIDETNRGPILIQAVAAYAWNGDLRDLAQITDTNYLPLEVRRPGVIEDELQPPTGIVDSLAQTEQGLGRMPEPLTNWDGIHNGEYGTYRPPDTTGDVGPNHYIQGVNVSIGIFDKATGTRLAGMSFSNFFQGPPGSICDNQHGGDILVNYDPMADRWIISDLGLPYQPAHLCLAVSQTGDPVSGGWYFYDILIADPDYGSWCDYPKIGVWPDAYYLTCNMFDPWIGANVFALDRASMLGGAPANVVMFRTGTDYVSLLPANLRGPLPPAGSPNYLASTSAPNRFQIWEFHVDWATPGNSTLTGPVELEVANFSRIWTIPQPGGYSVMSLGDRPMHFLQYRNYGDHEALFVNQTIPSGDSSGVRWYEVRDPGGKAVVYQEGTYAPDDDYRWMGSIAADQDGNVAVGYSVSSLSLYPSIRYTGRMDGEVLGQMAQGEISLVEGGGSQTGADRWGDYSSMSVDPVDDCTFWYTQEYIPTTTNIIWYTRIGSFKFPSCGLPKGWIAGTVYNSVTGAPVANTPVVVAGTTIAMTMTVQADANGTFTIAVPDGNYDLTAGPLLPGYPGQGSTVAAVTAGNTTDVSLYLDPVPYFVSGPTQVDDNVSGGNGNGYPEPGESGMGLMIALSNTGALTATGVSAHLVSLTPGVTVETADAGYPDTGIGADEYNLIPYVFSVNLSVPCGARMEFEAQVVTDQGAYTVPVRAYARVALPRESYLADDMENGEGGWVHAGPQDRWAITTENSHSPTHAWSDSPNGSYPDSGNSWLRSPIFDLTLQTGFRLSFWHRYDLEDGFDSGYVEYSTDYGSTWEKFPVLYTGSTNGEYVQETLDAAVLDDHSAVSFRFRMKADANIHLDGWHIDDVDLTYTPYACYYGIQPAVPVLVAPADGTVTTTHDLALSWQPGDALPVDYYQLDVDGSVVTTTELSAPVTLAAGTHDWTVSACGEYGCSADATPWTIQVIDAPGLPLLVAPADGTVTATHSLVLDWEAGAGGAPTGYNVNLDGTVYTATDSFLAVDLASGLHSWQVNACNVAGCSEYTTAWLLTVLDAPLTPMLVAPLDGVLITTTHGVAFAWAPGAGSPVDSYNLEVNGVVYTTTDTAYTLTLPVGPFSWRVQAVNAAGASAYTAAWAGEIVDPAGVPVLLAPADETVTTTQNLTLTWAAGTGGAPEGYVVEVDGVPYTATQAFLSVTLPIGTHTWRVRAYNEAGYTDYSAEWTVTVEEEVTSFRVFLPVVQK